MPCRFVTCEREHPKLWALVKLIMKDGRRAVPWSRARLFQTMTMAQALHAVPDEHAEEDPMAQVTVVAEANLHIGEAIARLQKSQAHLADCERAMKDFQRHVKDPDLVSKTAKLTSGLTRQLCPQ